MNESLSPYYDELLSYTRARLGCVHQAEDLVQDAFTKVLKRDSNDIITQPKAYLYRVVINLINDRNRRAKPIPESLEESSEPKSDKVVDFKTPAELLTTQEAGNLLTKAIDQLPEKCQAVFKMHRYEGMKYREIAAKLQISERTVEKHIAYALVHLRRSLRDLF